MSEKNKGLLVNLLVYGGAFGLALIPFSLIGELLYAEAAFTLTATLLIYAVSCVLGDTSLYDPYWSAAPPVMLLIAMIKYRLWSLCGLLFLLAVLVWSVRLTGNWAIRYRGLGREDWRYRGFRDRLRRLPFELLNLCGFMLMPTAVVFAGLIGGFYVLRAEVFRPMMLAGLLIMLAGTLLEHIADTAMSDFLRHEENSSLCCRVGVWKYSRHPNYLGEMSFWFGVFVSYAALYPAQWVRGLGFLLIVGVFLFVSIPMMEAHNRERRSDYEEYREKTSPLFLLPPRR